MPHSVIGVEDGSAERKILSRIVYLDGHATTPLATEAAEAMAPYWAAMAGNAQSPHARGQQAAAAIELGRAQVARLIGAEPQEVVFTSGATEANNLVILGVADAARQSGHRRNKIIASAIEHKSVLAALDELAARGFEVTLAPVTPDGVVDIEELKGLVDEATLLVSIMGANNEVGTIQPVAEAARLARAKGALIHSDLAQMVGKVAVDVVALDIDYASLSAHKFYGPMGIGAVYVSGLAAVKPKPQVFGGGQERGLRPGTLPTPLIVGFGAAAAVAHGEMMRTVQLQTSLASELLAGLEGRQVQVLQNASAAPRLPGSLSLQLPNANADEVVSRLSSSVCLSTGSACSAGQISVSHVLKAMSMSDGVARTVLRIYIGRDVTASDIDFAAAQIAVAVGG